jgi:hypothetical protein
VPASDMHQANPHRRAFPQVHRIITGARTRHPVYARDATGGRKS